jgi:hypothetical protein
MERIAATSSTSPLVAALMMSSWSSKDMEYEVASAE